MKLLFDQNISFRIIKKIEDDFPGAKQVKDLNLYNATDLEIWKFARDNDFSIVTCDSDFINIGLLKGVPPKIIWIRIGHTTTEHIASRLRAQVEMICLSLISPEEAFLEIH